MVDLGRRAGRGCSFPPRLVRGSRRRTQGGRGQRRRHRGDGGTRHRSAGGFLGARPTCRPAGRWTSPQGLRDECATAGVEPARRRRHPGPRHHDRGHRAGRAGRARAGRCGPARGPGDVVAIRGRRAGPPPAWSSWVAASARRAPWSRPSACPRCRYGAGAVGRRGRGHGHDRHLRRPAGRSRSCGAGVRRGHRPRQDAFEVPEPLQAVAAATGTDPYS